MKLGDFKKIFAFLLLGLFLAGVAFIADPFKEKTEKDKEIWNLIEKEYFEIRDSKECFDKILQGGLAACLDDHSRYLTPSEVKESESDSMGKFFGIGAELTQKDGSIVVVAPLEGTPADKTGIKAGDIIVQIDDTPTKRLTLLEAVRLIRGDKGKPVKLKIFRDKKILDFVIVRDEIVVLAVRYEMIGNIGYIRISTFSAPLASELINVLFVAVDKNHASSLIIDLRNNPGGLLNSALDSLNLFTQYQDKLLTVKGRNRKDKQFEARVRSPFFGLPIVVLVNEGSASASEIFAGAMQDLGYATIVGIKTFGKGVVQQHFDLKDGSVLSLTIEEYFVGPNEKKVHGIGIIPDIEVKPQVLSEKDEEKLRNSRKADPDLDNQLKKAIEILRKN